MRKADHPFVALTGWRSGCALPDRRPVQDWARDHVKLGGGYARQGSFDIRTCRHLEQPFAAVQDDRVREITCRAAVQTLKTLFVEITSLWAIANEPGPMMWTQQDDDSAKEHTKGRYRGLLRNCEPVARLLPRDRHDKSTNEIYFGDFYLIVNGANRNNLQSKSIRWKLNSECWLWKQGLLEDARMRVTAYKRDGISKIINESQGSYVNDDFDRLWLEGTREVWNVPCLACGEMQPLEFFARMKGDDKLRAGVVWADDARREDGSWNKQRVRETAVWRCPSCGHNHENTARTRAAWNARGRYVGGNPEADGKHRSFHWNALIADDLGDLAEQFVVATAFKKLGQLEPLKNFYMKRLGLSWKDEQENFSQQTSVVLSDYTLAQMHENGAKKIDGETKRICTIDRQRDHFWVVIRAWRTAGTARLLWRGKVLTTEQINDLCAHFGLEKQLVCEDAQYDTAQVYEDCVRYGWTALHGSGDESFPHMVGGKKVYRFYSPLKQTQVPGGMARYMFWSSDKVKDVLASLRKAGALELPSDIGLEYLIQIGIPQRQEDGTFKQIGGEAKRERINKGTGRSEWRWVKVGANHMNDDEAMQTAVALALQILPSPETVDAPAKQ